MSLTESEYRKYKVFIYQYNISDKPLVSLYASLENAQKHCDTQTCYMYEIQLVIHIYNIKTKQLAETRLIIKRCKF